MNSNTNSNSNGDGKKKKKAADSDNCTHYKKPDHKEPDCFTKYPKKIPEWWSEKYGDSKKDKSKDDSKPADSNKSLIAKSGIRDDN